MPSKEQIHQESLKKLDQYLQKMKSQLHNSIALCFSYISTTIAKMGLQDQSVYIDSYLDVFYNFLDSIKLSYANLCTENFILNEENAALKEKLRDFQLQHLLIDSVQNKKEAELSGFRDSYFFTLEKYNKLTQEHARMAEENLKLRIASANLTMQNTNLALKPHEGNYTLSGHISVVHHHQTSSNDAANGLHFSANRNSSPKSAAGKDLKRNSNDNECFDEKPHKQLRMQLATRWNKAHKNSI